ncbi:hypothetical protein ACFL6X_03890 [Candidatus Latescibacterota bacterium]
MRDWASLIRDLVDRHYPEADRITLVMDSTHQAQETLLSTTI